MLDFSRRLELSLHATVVADVQAAAAPLGMTPLITGAFARDLHLWYAHAIEIERETEDVDFAFAVPDWAAFGMLREQLITSGNFQPRERVDHKLQHKGGLPVDLVPFGGVEGEGRIIAWPPVGDEVMNVFGYSEALNSAMDIVLPRDVHSRVVSLPGLALLKLVCWQERHRTSPGRDARDLQHMLRNYLHAGNEQRLWDDHVHWAEADDFDYELAGSRMLGMDIGKLLDAVGKRTVLDLLAGQTDANAHGRLPPEMLPHDPDRAVRLLRALLRGLLGNDLK